MELKSLPMRKILVDEAVSITKEIYLGITNDRTARKPVMMASSAGGVDIEEVAAAPRKKLSRFTLTHCWACANTRPATWPRPIIYRAAYGDRLAKWRRVFGMLRVYHV